MRAVMDWYSVATDGLFSSRGKLATLWFEQLVLQVPSEELLTKCISSLRDQGGFSNETADMLFQIWKPVHEFIPSWTFLSPDSWTNSDPTVSGALIEAIQQDVRKHYPESAGTYAEAREVALGGAGYLDVIEIWTKLNLSTPCTFVANASGEAILRAVIPTPPDNEEFQTFSRIATIPIPDFSKLSWDQVLELRNDRYFQNFRSALAALRERIAVADDQQVAEIVTELRSKEMERIVRDSEPAVGTAVIKGILGNLPGLPVNPVSMWSSASEIWDNLQRGRMSGWLYFLLKMENVGRSQES